MPVATTKLLVVFLIAHTSRISGFLASSSPNAVPGRLIAGRIGGRGTARIDFMSVPPPKTTTTRILATQHGLSDIIGLYDAFLIDQWGVMHNGKDPYPGAVECIDRIAEAGKTIVLLSNSSRPKGTAMTSLQRMGFRTEAITDVVTSGQIALDGLRDRVRKPFASLGTKCLVFGNGNDDLEYVSGCGCEVAEADTADFILARGSFVVVGSRGERRYSPTIMTEEGKKETDEAMRIMLQRGAPMLVTNPDFLRPGTNDPMPGLIGKAYAEMGGTVHYVGKPHGLVYEACFDACARSKHASSDPSPTAGTLEASKMAAIGDSLHHDILGALRMGIASVFVTGGVHSEEFGVTQGAGEVVDDDVLQATIRKHLGAEGTPTHVVPSFRW